MIDNLTVEELIALFDDAIERKDLDDAQMYFGKMSLKYTFTGALNRQRFLCKKVKLSELQNRPLYMYGPLVIEALSLTLEDYENADINNTELSSVEKDLLEVYLRIKNI